MKRITRYKLSTEITDKTLAQINLRMAIKKKKNIAEK